MKYALLLDLIVVSVYDEPITPPPGYTLIETADPSVTNGMRYVDGKFYPGSYNDFLNLRRVTDPDMLRQRALVVDTITQMQGF